MRRKNLDLSSLLEPATAARTEIDDRKLEELASSIRQIGLLQPLIVKPAGDGKHEVVAGHRRLLALRRLNEAKADCFVLEKEELEEAVQIHENVEREELNPADEALRYMELYEKLGDTNAVAELVKKPLDYVERRMNLVYNADAKVLEALRSKAISIGVAEELNKMELEEDRSYHLHFAVNTGTTVRQMRDYRIRANAAAERARDVEASAPAEASSSETEKPTAPPAPEYTAWAKPYELSAEIDPRPCLFCARTFPEHRMFKKFVCGECADTHLVPLEKKNP